MCSKISCNNHLNANNFIDPFQSAYRAKHSTETAIIKVLSDIVPDVATRRIVVVVLLDMSAAFDTVDHVTLMNRLETRYAISGTAHAWFGSYLKGWKSQVSFAGSLSDSVSLQFGVPQWSVLGPLLFMCYANPIGNIVRSHHLKYHIYADDCQIYDSFDPHVPNAKESTLAKISECIAEIRRWLSVNYLKLNDSKSEFFITGSDHCLRHLNTDSIDLTIGNSNIMVSPVIRNLGCFFDAEMSFTPHVDNLRRTILFHIRNLWRIRRFMNTETCHHAVRALITSRLDYCNAAFTLLSAKDISRLQRLQNRAARLVFAVGRRVAADSLIHDLHWLPIKQRIIFKVLLYVYKTLNNSAPTYMADLFNIYTPPRPLRSAMDTSRLVVPITKSHLAMADRSFPGFFCQTLKRPPPVDT